MKKQDFKQWLQLNLSYWEYMKLADIFGGLTTYKLTRRLAGEKGWEKEPIQSFIEYAIDSDMISIDEIAAGVYEWLKQFDFKLNITIEELKAIDKHLTERYSWENAEEPPQHPVYIELNNIRKAAKQ